MNTITLNKQKFIACIQLLFHRRKDYFYQHKPYLTSNHCMRLASSSVNEIFFISPAYIFPYIHTYIHTIYTHIHAYTDTYIPTYKHACIHCTSIYSSMSIYGGISGGNVLEEKCPDENVLDPRTHYIGGVSF